MSATWLDVNVRTATDAEWTSFDEELGSAPAAGLPAIVRTSPRTTSRERVSIRSPLSLVADVVFRLAHSANGLTFDNPYRSTLRQIG